MDMFERMTIRTALAMAFCAALLGGTAFDAASEEAAAGDIAAGKTVAESCTTCHNLDGMGKTPEVPHLAGQYAGYILKALQGYREGARAKEFMVAMIVAANTLSEEDMANVAAYYASLKPFPEIAAQAEKSPAPLEEDPFAAVKEMTEGCAGCHGEDGNSELPGTPGVAGQHAEYLIDALKAYKTGARKDEMMQTFVESLSTAEIDEIAYYYAVATPKRTEAPVAGDAFAGRAPAAACAVCHGEDGNADDPKTPRLAGLDSEYLAAAMAAYRDGTREHTVMQDIVAALSKTDIDNMAAFYATKEPKALRVRKPLTTKDWAEKCNRCHGPGGNSTDPRFPILAGQSEAYLLKTLKVYHGGERSDPMMYAMSFQMNEADINKLAAYYARSAAQ
jgi:cytochrome c553